VLLPLAIVTWLGLRVAGDQRAVHQHEFQSLLSSRLRDVENGASRAMEELERHLVREVIGADVPPPETLRALRRKEPLIREMFVLDADGRLLFPPDDDTASADERAFSTRTMPIWRRDAVLYDPPAREGDRKSAPDAGGRSDGGDSPSTNADVGDDAVPGRPAPPSPGQIRGDSVLDLAKTRAHGWISWYWEEGLHLMFWRRSADGGVIGAEIERVALLARVVGRLPTTELDDGRIALVDSRGDIIHQWGPYQPPADERPVATLPMRHPLDAWRLRYFASPSQRRAFFGGGRLNLMLGLAGLAIALFAMAFYLYRDYTKRVRDAVQRVNFVTQVSHELKTPLANIRLYAELLESDLTDLIDQESADHQESVGPLGSAEYPGPTDSHKLLRRLSVIVSESQRLSRLIDNILLYARQRRDQVELRAASVCVDDVVRAVLDQFAPALAVKNIEVAFAPDAATPIQIDADAIGQIVSNLVSNVDKYGATGEHLAVTTEQRAADDGRLITTVTVADRGPGIPRAHRGKIFRPFYRVSDKLADGVTGTGIGLAISRQLARRLGGDLTLTPSDEGARFALTLATPKPTDAAVASDDDARKGEP
jgi:signal transduction histidine kinase